MHHALGGGAADVPKKFYFENVRACKSSDYHMYSFVRLVKATRDSTSERA